MYFNPETGNYDSHSRIYRSTLTIWLSKDPIDEQGGLNLYGYVGNNPLNYFDPFGYEKGAEALMRLTRNSKGMAGDMPMSPLSLLRIILGTPFSIISGDIFYTSQDNPEINGCSATITVNGILNERLDRDYIQNSVASSPRYTGSTVIKAVNPTTGPTLGWFNDLVQILGDEVSGIQTPSIQLAKRINSTYDTLSQKCACAKIQVVAHSQGTMVFLRAVPLIRKEALRLIYYTGLGGETTMQGVGELAHQETFINYTSFWSRDWVPVFGNVLNPLRLITLPATGLPEWKVIK